MGLKALTREDFIPGDIIEDGEINNIAVNSNAILKTLVAGETIVAGKPCFVADGGTDIYELINTNYSTAGNNIYGASIRQGTTFKTKASPYGTIVLTTFKLYTGRTGSPAGNCNIDIYAVDGNRKPTGSSLGTASVTATSVVNGGWTSFTANISLSPNTEYAMIMSVPSGNSSNYINWYQDQADGTRIMFNLGLRTTDGGSSWTIGYYEDRTLQAKFSYVFGVAGKVYNSYGDVRDRNHFDCFSLESKTVDQDCLFQFDNLVGGLTNITLGKKHYLSDFYKTIMSQQTTDSNQPIYSSYWEGQTFTTLSDQTHITKFKVKLTRQNNPTGTVTFSIYATSAGLPTGSALVSKVMGDVVEIPSGVKEQTIELDSPLAVSASTVYAVIISVSAGNASNRLDISYNSSSLYASGNRVYSTNAGGSWSADTGGDHFLVVYGICSNLEVAPLTTDTLLGVGVSTTEIIMDKEEHLIEKKSVSEANTSGASSSCEATYTIPPRTTKILINGSYSNGSLTNKGQLIINLPYITSAIIYDDDTNDTVLTVTVSGNQLTINSKYLTGTPTFVLDICYIGK